MEEGDASVIEALDQRPRDRGSTSTLWQEGDVESESSRAPAESMSSALTSWLQPKTKNPVWLKSFNLSDSML